MQHKDITLIKKNVSSEIKKLLANGFFATHSMIGDGLVKNLEDLSVSSDSYTKAYGLLHLGRYICEGRVKNKPRIEGINFFNLLGKERLLNFLERDERDVIADATEKAALSVNNHKEAVKILKDCFTSLKCENVLAALSDCLLTGRFPPIEKNAAQWILILYELISKSLTTRSSDFDFYIHHLLNCASTYQAKEHVIKVLSNIISSESWNDDHMLQLQGNMIAHSQKDKAVILEINRELQVIGDEFLTNSPVQTKV